LPQAAKERNRATFGWEAFTAEAGYKSYNKRLAKLPGAADGDGSSGSSSSSANPLSYGKSGSDVTKNGINRMVSVHLLFHDFFFFLFFFLFANYDFY
jgi:hypothetical protein